MLAFKKAGRKEMVGNQVVSDGFLSLIKSYWRSFLWVFALFCFVFPKYICWKSLYFINTVLQGAVILASLTSHSNVGAHMKLSLV